MKRILAIIMVCVLTFTLFAGCKKEEELSPIIQINTDEVTVPLEEVMFYVFNMQVQYENDFGPNIMFEQFEEGVTMGDKLKNEALETAITVNLCAMEARNKGLSVDSDTEAAIKQQAKDYFEALDMSVIEEYNFTPDLFEEVFMEYELRSVLMADFIENLEPDQALLEGDLQVLADKDAYYALMREIGIEEMSVKTRARHILVYTVDENGSYLSEEEQAKKLEIIENAKAALDAGESFDSVVEQYSDDTLSLEEGGEYTISRGQKGPEFDAAISSLEVGTISDIIEVSYGYHIIEVLEKDIKATDEEIAILEQYEADALSYAMEAQGESRFEDQYEVWTKENDIKINQGLWKTVEVKGSSNVTSGE